MPVEYVVQLFLMARTATESVADGVTLQESKSDRHKKQRQMTKRVQYEPLDVPEYHATRQRPTHHDRTSHNHDTIQHGTGPQVLASRISADPTSKARPIGRHDQGHRHQARRPKEAKKVNTKINNRQNLRPIPGDTSLAPPPRRRPPPSSSDPYVAYANPSASASKLSYGDQQDITGRSYHEILPPAQSSLNVIPTSLPLHLEHRQLTEVQSNYVPPGFDRDLRKNAKHPLRSGVVEAQSAGEWATARTAGQQWKAPLNIANQGHDERRQDDNNHSARTDCLDDVLAEVRNEPEADRSVLKDEEYARQHHKEPLTGPQVNKKNARVPEGPIPMVSDQHPQSEFELTSSTNEGGAVSLMEFQHPLARPQSNKLSKDEKLVSKTVRPTLHSLEIQTHGKEAVLPLESIGTSKSNSVDGRHRGAATSPLAIDRTSPQPHQESLTTPVDKDKGEFPLDNSSNQEEQQDVLMGVLDSSRSLAELRSPSLCKSMQGSVLSSDQQAGISLVFANPDHVEERRVGNEKGCDCVVHSPGRSSMPPRSPEGQVNTSHDGADDKTTTATAEFLAPRSSRHTHVHLSLDTKRYTLQVEKNSSPKARSRLSPGFLEPQSNYEVESVNKGESITVEESTSEKKAGKRSWKSIKIILANVRSRMRSKPKSNTSGRNPTTEKKGESVQVRDGKEVLKTSLIDSRWSSSIGEAETISLAPVTPDLGPVDKRQTSQDDGLGNDNSLRGQLVRLGKQTGSHPELLAAAGLLAFAVFRANDSASRISLTQPDTISSLSGSFPLARPLLISALAVVALLGALALSRATLDNVEKPTFQSSTAILAKSAQQSDARSDPDDDRMASDSLDAEDALLRNAQEEIRGLFPDHDLQITMLPLFLDLVQAPWQELDPGLWRRLRREARKHWGTGHQDRLATAIDSLRGIAVQLFTDYLKVEDRGAYLTGELLRVEMMSNPDAIRISVFLGDNVDGRSDTSREKNNWERGLRTLRDLPHKWSDMFTDQNMPPVEIVACRPPADFDSTRFQFLRDCAKAPGRVSENSLDRYEGVKQQWMTCKSRGIPLCGLRKLIGVATTDEQDRMLLDLFELTKPPRITVDYLPHRHRQADILGWSRSKTPSRLLRTSCFRHVARACAAYTKENDLDILDLGPCLPMDRDGVRTDDGSSPAGMRFAFSKTRVSILRISLDECKEFMDPNGETEAACLAATLCQPEKRLISMFTGNQPPWLVVHVRTAGQKAEFRNVLEGCLFACHRSGQNAKAILALMPRVCCTIDSSAGSTRIWSDAEIGVLKTAVESG